MACGATDGRAASRGSTIVWCNPFKVASMGAIADAIVSYAQPLLDATDGSEEQMNKALAISQLCWNLALLPSDSQESGLGELRASLNMDDDEFDDFRRTMIVPMIQRHQEMFPQ